MNRNKIRASKHCIEVTCDRNDTETHILMTEFYPVEHNRIKTSFKLSPRLLPEVLKTLRGVDESNIHNAPALMQELYWSELRARANVSDLIDNGPREDCKISERLTLMRHQQLGREIARYRDRYAFFYDTRTGKTPLSLSIIHDDLVDNPDHKWLVVCPLILIDNAWMPDSKSFFPEISTINCHGNPAARQLAFSSNSQIYVTNTESFVNNRELIEKVGFHGCIVDESSDMKSPSSKVSKGLVDFAQYMNRFYLLAGTPAPNGEYEYYMQMRAVDYYGWQSSYNQFKLYYFVNMSYNVQYEKLATRPDRRDELISNIKKYALYVDKTDVLDLPGRTFHEVEVELPKELKKHYNTLKNELYIELGDGLKITAPHAGAKLNKLNQVTSGFIMDTQAAKENKFYDNDKPEWYLLDRYRYEVLQELLERPNIKGEKVLIWANYRREFELIKELLEGRAKCVYGGSTLAEKNDAIQDFKFGELQYLVANPASADKGLTLTSAHISIYFSLNWSYELFRQSYDRIYGAKTIQPHHCDYYIIIAKGTIDRVLYSDVLQGKGDASYAVLNHLKGRDLC